MDFNPILLAAIGVVAYSGLMLILNNYLLSSASTKTQFMLANRNIPLWMAAPALSAMWMWIIVFVVAPQVAFTQGWVGLFWFSTANCLGLAFFAWFIMRMRETYPDGFTLSDCMLRRYSPRVQGLYAFQLVAAAICVYATQLLAGAVIIAPATGLTIFQVTVILALCSLCYSMIRGVKASVLNSFIKYFVVISTLLVVAFFVYTNSGGWETITKGLYGPKGNFTSLISGDGATVFWSFGIAVTLALLSSPFGGQAFWQQGFAIKKEHVFWSFIMASILFLIVPLILGTLGFIAVGSGLQVTPQNVGGSVVSVFAPTWVLVLFTFAMFFSLISILDIFTESFSNLVGYDLFNRFSKTIFHGLDDETASVSLARYSMPVFVVLSILLANAPGVQVLYLFLFYGTIRTATLIPTIITVITQKGQQFISEKGMFYGVIGSFVIGLPIAILGNFGGPELKYLVPVGSLVMLFTSTVVILGLTYYEKRT